MRINRFVAKATGLGRRAVDTYISEQRILVNGSAAKLGQEVEITDRIEVDGSRVDLPSENITILFNKPVGYISSRKEQGSPTIYELLPSEFKNLKTAGRLDRESSGLMILTSDGELSYRLTHPKFAKSKIYQVQLNKALSPSQQQIIERGEIKLDGRPSKLNFKKMLGGRDAWEIEISEGRNRQIRRTFDCLGYEVKGLHRIQIGPFVLSDLGDKPYLKLEKIPDL
ncbi:MAG TPA: pseudouridine synthase [Candidatus Saccharimonadales bacterium]|nr:pseudouridine synthase [Candidatus Saccharimonadales bacterium]